MKKIVHAMAYSMLTAGLLASSLYCREDKKTRTKITKIEIDNEYGKDVHVMLYGMVKGTVSEQKVADRIVRADKEKKLTVRNACIHRIEAWEYDKKTGETVSRLDTKNRRLGTKHDERDCFKEKSFKIEITRDGMIEVEGGGRWE